MDVPSELLGMLHKDYEKKKKFVRKSLEIVGFVSQFSLLMKFCPGAR
jgi:hypothetical protein